MSDGLADSREAPVNVLAQASVSLRRRAPVIVNVKEGVEPLPQAAFMAVSLDVVAWPNRSRYRSR